MTATHDLDTLLSALSKQDLLDDVSRMVLADAFEDTGRDDEASLCRSHQDVYICGDGKGGRVIRETGAYFSHVRYVQGKCCAYWMLTVREALHRVRKHVPYPESQRQRTYTLFDGGRLDVTFGRDGGFMAKRYDRQGNAGRVYSV